MWRFRVGACSTTIAGASGHSAPASQFMCTSQATFLTAACMPCRRPVLCVEAKVPTGTLLLRLLPYASSSALALAKLAPDRNCVRAVRSSTSEADLLPTPYYNTGIIEVCWIAVSRPLLLI